MALYMRTLHVLPTKEEADKFNEEHGVYGNVFVEDFAIHYGYVPCGIRFENAIIKYSGVRNSTYESHLAEMQRNDVSTWFKK